MQPLKGNMFKFYWLCISDNMDLHEYDFGAKTDLFIHQCLFISGCPKKGHRRQVFKFFTALRVWIKTRVFTADEVEEEEEEEGEEEEVPLPEEEESDVEHENQV